ncbi:MAG: response regulator [Candidatus Promineifilaceae bacterium]|nr:response regulator [Candidatus Promineifilaceae bacterium]
MTEEGPSSAVIAAELTRPAHILVVDDEPEIAQSLADLLGRSAGYRVSQAEGGRQAMQLLEAAARDGQDAVDLVLLDVRMPLISGPEVLSWMRAHPRFQFTRVIMLTAAAGKHEKVEALSIGADDYITKPYHPPELLARVKTLLRSQQLEKQLQRQSRQLSTLNRVSRDVNARLSTDDVLAQAVEGVDAILDVELTAVFMINKKRTHLHCRQFYASGEQPVGAFAAIPLDQGAIGLVLQAGKSLRLNQPTADPRFHKDLDGPSSLVVRNMMAMPLLVRSKAVGVICAYNKRPGPFTELDRDLFASLASSVGRALEITWLFQSVRTRQQELLESRNMLQAVIDGILHPIYTINESWQLVAVNQTKAQALDLSTADLIGRPCFEAFFGRQRPCDHCAVSKTLQDQSAQRWSVSWQDEERLNQEWDVSTYPVPGAKTGAARAVIVWQDRTEERRLENSLMQAGKLAAIGQLAAGVAHEINNPLTAINANAQMLQMVLPADHEHFESVELIAQAGDRAAKVVRGLLDFARQAHYTFEPSDLNDSIHQAHNLVRYQLTTANIDVDFDLADELPQLAASWEHLKSVWLNLLINARDAVLERSDDRLIAISTKLDRANDQILVRIQDNGRGMSDAELNHIFEPFFTTKEPGQGTGLGLATCHRIIEQHGGQIEAFSAPDQGSTFLVRLPVDNGRVQLSE